MTPDINVLVAASRSDHVHHRDAIAWLNETLRASEMGKVVYILPMVSAGFLRLISHPKIFVNPTPIGNSIGFINALLALPGLEMPELGRKWPTLSHLCRRHKLSAYDVPNAWIAAAVRLTGDRLVTFDRGFRRLLSGRELMIL